MLVVFRIFGKYENNSGQAENTPINQSVGNQDVKNLLLSEMRNQGEMDMKIPGGKPLFYKISLLPKDILICANEVSDESHKVEKITVADSTMKKNYRTK